MTDLSGNTHRIQPAPSSFSLRDERAGNSFLAFLRFILVILAGKSNIININNLCFRVVLVISSNQKLTNENINQLSHYQIMRLCEYREISISKEYQLQAWKILSETNKYPPDGVTEFAAYSRKFTPSEFFNNILEQTGSGLYECLNIKLYHGIRQKRADDIIFSPGYLKLWIACQTQIQLQTILQLLHGEVAHKTIIDLGCGSNGGTEEAKLYNSEARFFPWLARVLHGLKAKSIGIDIGNLANEPFEAHQLNLLNSNSLRAIPSESVDLVNMYRLFDSPQLQRLASDAREIPPGEILAKHLHPQLRRILNPGGYCIYFYNQGDISHDERHSGADGWPFIHPGYTSRDFTPAYEQLKLQFNS